MCFSNLPVEFDDDGNPYLAAEADEVEHGSNCDCGTDVGLDEDDPEAVFEAVLSSVPESVHEDIVDRTDDRPEPATDAVHVDGSVDDPAEGD